MSGADQAETADGPPDHYEWKGHLYCDVEKQGFAWQTGEFTCPHCGEKVSNGEVQ